ncbi:OmpP1/FadL family transporter [Capnocytophaga canimorsus]|uniref:OmpP1/FadL family transporter n=1 Tax=Capnocytophaga canimorsus TaxID=28188 RepID=UPI0037D033F7
MKKILLLALGVTLSFSAFAQNEIDALRNSTENLHGTARYRALSGAFGALGGDLSAMSINPAGSAVFSSGALGLSLGNINTKNNATFFGKGISEENSDFDAEQLGGVFVFADPDEYVNKFSFGVNYQKTSDFEDNILRFGGRNNKHSVVDYFLEMADGVLLGDIETRGRSISQAYGDIGEDYGYKPQQAFLAGEAYLINPIDGSDLNNTKYVSAGHKPPVDQLFLQETMGRNYKLSFNFGLSLNSKFYLGMNLNSHNVKYRKDTRLIERNFEVGSNVKEVDFRNSLLTTGGGFSFQLGGIYREKDLRVGVAYQSPTWYRLEDETTQFLASSVDDSGTIKTHVIAPDVVNLYEEYKFRAPGQWTLSLAYIIGKRALLSADYQYKDYTAMRYSASYLQTENERIKNLFTGASSFRFGTEFKATPALSFRAGTSYEQSPYKDKKMTGNLTGYSLGMGYDFGGISLDFAYDTAKRSSEYQMYEIGLIDRAQVDTRWNSYMFTVLFKL